jgi:hypothetical protein
MNANTLRSGFRDHDDLIASVHGDVLRPSTTN